MARSPLETFALCPDQAGRPSWNAQPLMLGRIRFNDDMAADLVNFSVAPTSTQCLYEVAAAKISRQFHPVASTSSRTRCRRMCFGGELSKK